MVLMDDGVPIRLAAPADAEVERLPIIAALRQHTADRTILDRALGRIDAGEWSGPAPGQDEVTLSLRA
jgi:hypothetical protein